METVYAALSREKMQRRIKMDEFKDVFQEGKENNGIFKIFLSDKVI